MKIYINNKAIINGFAFGKNNLNIVRKHKCLVLLFI